MIRDILIELKKSSFSVLPIYLLVMLIDLLGIIELNGYEILSFSLATIFIIIGIALFNMGAEQAMTPIGKTVGRGLTKQGKIWILVLVVFLFGFLITIAEPDLKVLAIQTKSVFNEWLLVVLVGLSVGIFLLLAITKIIKKTDLIRILLFLYLVAFGLSTILIYQGKGSIIAMGFDSGGVTTGPMTVPFLMALGTGVAAVLAQKSERDASFGFVAFSSIGPIIVMLLMSIFSSRIGEFQLPSYEISDNFFKNFGYEILVKMYEVGVSIGLLFVAFVVIDLFILKTEKKKKIQLYHGLILSYIGLVLFLSSVSSTYMGVGYKLGATLENTNIYVVLIVAFVIGALTVLAEPAIKILITQVEEITNGLIKKVTMLVALAIGVGMAILLALLRIYLDFSILYLLIPGYIICFGLAFFIPKIYTAIAFDAGGVVSGPLTSSFILPIALGYCGGLAGDTLSMGFGIVALVAISPLLSIEILGVYSFFRNRILRKRAMRSVLKEDDKIIISFNQKSEV